MSIASALHNATTGLLTSARAVQVASTNVANAMTEGYAPRQLDLTAASLGGVGGGVRVAGVSRQVDPVLLGMHRDAGASTQAASRGQAFWQAAETAIGLPGNGINAALSGFETALIAASERPDLPSRLTAVIDNANALIGALDRAQSGIQAQRATADAAIARDVDTLNAGLARVDHLNTEIVRMRAAGQSTLGLEDDRQALVSSLSEIVPLREFQRPDGRLTLFSDQGRLLLDIDPQVIEFSASPVMQADRALGSGLSGLTIGGVPVDTGENGPLAGGRLAANFALRDTAGPDVQTRLDAIAADLVARFEAAATDPTRAPGAPGLFTDDGAPLAAVPAPGLAGRLALNGLVVPEAGGAVWRLRDGLGAAIPGAVGNGVQIGNLLGALDRVVSGGPGIPARSLAGTLADFGAYVSTARNAADDRATHETARLGELTEQTLANGVDTDAEMQRLISIEQAYAANARVIQTADFMLQRLLEI